MNIRKADMYDIPSMCSLLSCLFSQEEEFVADYQKQQNGLKMIIEDSSIGDIYVATIDKKVVAMVSTLYSVSTALGARVAILEDMVVDEKFQNQQIGTKLIEYALDTLKDKKIKRVTLLTDNINEKAKRFYERLGFKSSPMVPYRVEL